MDQQEKSTAGTDGSGTYESSTHESGTDGQHTVRHTTREDFTIEGAGASGGAASVFEKPDFPEQAN